MNPNWDRKFIAVVQRAEMRGNESDVVAGKGLCRDTGLWRFHWGSDVGWREWRKIGKYSSDWTAIKSKRIREALTIAVWPKCVSNSNAPLSRHPEQQ